MSAILDKANKVITSNCKEVDYGDLERNRYNILLCAV